MGNPAKNGRRKKQFFGVNDNENVKVKQVSLIERHFTGRAIPLGFLFNASMIGTLLFLCNSGRGDCAI